MPKKRGNGGDDKPIVDDQAAWTNPEATARAIRGGKAAAALHQGVGSRKRSRRPRSSGDALTAERDYTRDEVEFMLAMAEYKHRSGRMFPTWSEVLEVLRSLGYRKVADPQLPVDLVRPFERVPH